MLLFGKRYDMLSEEIEAVKSIWHMSIKFTQKSHHPRGGKN